MEVQDGSGDVAAALQAPPTSEDQAMVTPLSPQILDLEASLVSDPILDLCPSLDLLKSLARSSAISADVKQQKLRRALLRAASNGDTDMLSWLLDPRNEARVLIAGPDAGIDANGRPRIAFDEIRDEDGTGPVVLASCAGHVDCVTMLVMSGADVDERDACGWTPLMWATNSSNLTLAAYLLQHGADVEARSSKGTSCEDFILSAAPDAAGVKQLGGAGGQVERDQLADLIYEHQVSASMQASTTQKLRDLSLSSPGGSGSTGRSSAGLLPSMEVGGAWPNSGQPLHSRASSLSTFKPGHSRTSSQITASRRLVGRVERAHIADQELRAREVAEGRKRALLDIAVMLELDYAALIGEPVGGAADESASGASGASRSTRRKGVPKVPPSGLASGCGAAEVGSDLLSVEFDWSKVRSDQMLVFGLNDLTPLLDRMVTKIRPLRAPWTSRAAPANVLFLCARYACSLGDEELLEELFLGAIDRIEGSIYAHPTDMTYLAFWLYNSCLLHYYTQKDATLRASEAVGEYRSLLADLLNEIYVFVIRDAERRIDKALDQAILDHEAIEGFDEVRFEGEWKFMRTLAGSVKGIGQQTSLSAAASSAGSSGGHSGGAARRPISQIFGRREQNGSDSSQPGSSTSPSLGVGSPSAKAGSLGRPEGQYRFPTEASSPSRRPLGDVLSPMREMSCNLTAADLLTKPSPRTITSLLTSTLHVLQLYEINPAIIIQGLSQIFFWVGCELFNRVLSRKRYLCRSRAMQIRLNVSALEDWARSNALPLSIVHAHLSPLSQLVSWLQCQSSLNEFDGLIATMQGLKALNPLQMRKAVKDYRYEVGETRMSEECVQYLDQLIIDWKRRQEDQARQQAIEERAIQRRRKQATQQQQSGLDPKPISHHHRSGTATQDGYTPDSRSPSPSSLGDGDDSGFRGAAYSDDPQDLAMDVDGDAAQASGDRSRGSVYDAGDASVSTIATAGPSEPLTVAEATAQSAQQAIDGLFAPGKSMADYVPPWTAAGAPLGINGRSLSTSVPETVTEMLNSRDMLPFALPSRPDAMVVTPGDAFGFGRGHFTGTGTPSLRSAAGSESGSVRSSQSSAASSRRGSRPTSPDAVSSIDADVTADAESVVSGASNSTAMSNASRSSLFPQGKGFAAGGSWSPVPLLADPLLDEIYEIMRRVAMLGEWSSSSADPEVSVTMAPDPTPSASAAALSSPSKPAGAVSIEQETVQPFRIPPRRSSSMLRDEYEASAPAAAAVQYPSSSVTGRGSPLKRSEPFSPSLMEEQEDDVEGGAAAGYDEGSLKRRESGLSFKPNRLVIPERGRVEIQFGDEFDERDEDGDASSMAAKTPTAAPRSADLLR
ncbi:uncharacterized protein PFL1_03633 [Pseudozyma flocculosa PF-1]|uniref:Dilute domain-containing protein n=2 Tax=Pseudozyma flocculosa TaxID=84751 RepID=A0A5C3F7K2_9BASI|nr:uncharacterized protein PFL1_03633 [Pseudozyma flocculosa PF-1]EPQ28830.1 hypothetical protein PFL1_03633 [Pseudozyma flocculosa PF-1]SPO39379.1 uncharacterized protein PSFLO_04860 [Pseudozyma flocculosa]